MLQQLKSLCLVQWFLADRKILTQKQGIFVGRAQGLKLKMLIQS